MRNLILLFISFISISTFCFFGCSKASDNMRVLNPTGKGGSTARFTIYGTYLYTVDGTTLSTYDIAGGTPVLKDQQEIGFEIETIYPFNGLLLIGSTSVIHIFDLDNPSKPLKLSEAISPSVLRRCDPVIAKGNSAYATLRTGTECGGVQSVLAVYNISDPTNPQQVFTQPMTSPRGLDFSDTVLYVADPPGFYMFNISQPEAPVFIEQFGMKNYYDVITYGNELFAISDSATDIFSIVNPTKPELLATIQ